MVGSLVGGLRSELAALSERSELRVWLPCNYYISGRQVMRNNVYYHLALMIVGYKVLMNMDMVMRITSPCLGVLSARLTGLDDWVNACPNWIRALL